MVNAPISLTCSKLRIQDHLDGNGYAWTATFLVDGVPSFSAHEDGRGGQMRYVVIDRARYDQAVAYANALRPDAIAFDMSLHLVCEDLMLAYDQNERQAKADFLAAKKASAK